MGRNRLNNLKSLVKLLAASWSLGTFDASAAEWIGKATPAVKVDILALAEMMALTDDEFGELNDLILEIEGAVDAMAYETEGRQRQLN
ncbi:hypothetical protein [Devosia sp. DBB001]|jgi:hypothetical protein|nr:hypothetical protein [Devosia sp. DBB001]